MLAAVIIWGTLAGGPALIVAVFAALNFYTFADNIKSIAEGGETPETMAKLANQAAFISMMSLTTSLLGYLVGPSAELFIPKAWAMALFGSMWLSLFEKAWLS